MRDKLIFSFAAGLLVATSISGAAYFLDTDKNSNKKAVEPLTEKEMKEKLTNSGYVIHTEEEWNEIIAAEKKAKTEAKKEEETQTAKNTEKEKTVYRTFLTVSEGMTSIDVGKILEKSKILDDAWDFSKTVEKKGVENKLRPGTYELNSEMSMNEIISTIFK